MKVVLFCGGLGTRLREHSETLPKPLVSIGYRPIVWHLMKYYAHFGHKDFILCLGYRGDLVKDYFLNYRESDSNDVTISDGGKTIDYHTTDTEDWSVTLVDTGLHANLGQRLLRVKHLLSNEAVFLANYSDGLSDFPIDTAVDQLVDSEAIASFAAVRTWQSFHSAKFTEDGTVTGLGELSGQDFWINGGFFTFRSEIFDHIEEGEELVEQPFQRLIEKRQLLAHRHAGFWRSMDTFKDKISFDRDYARGIAPWEVWRKI
ncbi:MAG: sugar phosphate nucleotidyltransferase [Pseudomonadota bacterium]